MRRVQSSVFTVACGLILAASVIVSCSRGDDRPSVLLVSIDTLRPDHLGCYGHSRNTSPNIDALAAKGTLFETVHSTTSWTLPAHVALFTSLYDSLHGVTDNGMRLPEGIRTLAQVLKREGFKTAGVISGPYLHSAFGCSRGFEKYINVMDFFPDTAEGAVKPAEDIHLKSHQEITSPRVTEAAIAWLRRAGATPFFLFLHYFDVHYDFIPPLDLVEDFDPHYDGPVTGRNFLGDKRIQQNMAARDFQRLIALYDGEIRFVDRHIGLVLDALREAGRLEKTVVVVTSDHGEEFFEHGEKGHRKNLFETVVRIPLIFCMPGTIAAGRRVGGQARIIDIAPTLLDLLHIPPLQEEWLGKSLLPFMRPGGSGAARAQVPKLPVFCELVLPSSGMDVRALRMGRYKGIWDRIKGQAFFYDLKEDPGENNPLLAAGSDVFKEMEKKLLTTVKDLEKAAPRPGRARVDERTRKRLKELGYIEE